jgi:hypothetical protein
VDDVLLLAYLVQLLVGACELRVETKDTTGTLLLVHTTGSVNLELRTKDQTHVYCSVITKVYIHIC